MTVTELINRLSAFSKHDAEVIVHVPDPDDAETPDAYTIEDVTFIDWPEHYKQGGNALGVARHSRPEVYLKV